MSDPQSKPTRGLWVEGRRGWRDRDRHVGTVTTGHGHWHSTDIYKVRGDMAGGGGRASNDVPSSKDARVG